MPELPEIEVTRRDLEREVAGKKVKTVEVTGKGTLQRHTSKAQFQRRIEGRKIKSFDRRGTYIVGKLDSDDVWVIDLGPTGRPVLVKQGKPPADSSTRLTMHFTTGGAVRFTDADSSTKTFVLPKAELLDIPEIADIGVDPLETPLPWQQFGALLRQHKGKLKGLLQDPTVVAGVGPVYSDEILFAAGLRYDRTPESLSAHEVRRLYRAMVETLSEAIKYRGVTLNEDDVDMYGKPGDFGQYLQVFGRAGEPCRRCRQPVTKVKFQKRNHFYCPGCQS
jgi:formamidopyrimidine-DNA glycosylase